jgi:hypothetical protein
VFNDKVGKDIGALDGREMGAFDKEIGIFGKKGEVGVSDEEGGAEEVGVFDKRGGKISDK